MIDRTQKKKSDGNEYTNFNMRVFQCSKNLKTLKN